MLMQAPEGRRLIEPAPGRLLPNDAAKCIRAAAPAASGLRAVERGVVIRLAHHARATAVRMCGFLRVRMSLEYVPRVRGVVRYRGARPADSLHVGGLFTGTLTYTRLYIQ
jgi:hypothetical protein